MDGSRRRSTRRFGRVVVRLVRHAGSDRFREPVQRGVRVGCGMEAAHRIHAWRLCMPLQLCTDIDIVSRFYTTRKSVLMPQVIPPMAAPHGFGRTSRRDIRWTTPGRLHRLHLVHRLRHVGGVSERARTFGPYLSPFYSPVFFASPGDTAGLAHAWFGAQPAWRPSLIPFSPALLILPFPGVFRFTCYYYRGAYYKAFWADPLACSVGEPQELPRRELVPSDPPEHSPLCLSIRGALHLRALA